MVPSSKLTDMLQTLGACQPESIIALLKKNDLLSEKALNGESELHDAIVAVLQKWHDEHDNQPDLASWFDIDAVEHELFESGWLNKQGADLSNQGRVDGKSLGKFATTKPNSPPNFFQKFLRRLCGADPDKY